MKTFSKSALVLLALAVAGTPARSRSLHIVGTAGYLSEWELNGEVAETGTGSELVGPLVWKHIGLCGVRLPVGASLRSRLPTPGRAAVLPSSLMNWRRPRSSMGSSPETRCC